MNHLLRLACFTALLNTTVSYALAPADDSVAANYEVRLVLSGSSTFKDAFENQLSRVGSPICDTRTPTTYNKYTTQVGGPDLNAYTCLLMPGVTSVAGGERTIIYYRAEGGSIYGLTPIKRGTSILRLAVNGNCTVPGSGGTGICQVNSFNAAADSATGNALNAVPQVGFSDIEPDRFFGENYPDAATASKLQPALSSAERTALNNLSGALVAQSFGVYVNTQNAQIGTNASLSKAVLSSIVQGVYSDWNQVPKDDNSNATVTSISVPIVLCRGVPGSGAQAAASIFFNNQGCGQGYESASAEFPGNLLQVIENGAAATMRSCISTHVGAIGLLVSEPNATGRKQIMISGTGTTDQSTGSTNNLGAQTAGGRYEFVFESTAVKATGLSGSSLSLANKLISSVQSQSTGPRFPSITFLPAFNGSNAFFPLNTPPGTQPVSCFTRSKNSCAPLQNQC